MINVEVSMASGVKLIQIRSGGFLFPSIKARRNDSDVSITFGER